MSKFYYIFFFAVLFLVISCSKKSNVDQAEDSESVAGTASETETDSIKQGSDTVTDDSDKINTDSETSDTETSDTAPVSNPDADKLSGKETAPDVTWVKIEAGSFTFGSPIDTPCSSASEKEVPVILTHPFMMAATEVTQAQWSALDYPNPSWEKSENKPVTMINFFEAAAWCNKLSKMQGLDTCYDLSSCINPIALECITSEGEVYEGCGTFTDTYKCTGNVHKYSNYYECPGYRMPTSAEWEYAAKAGTTTHTYNGDVVAGPISACWDAQPSLAPIAWYCNNSDNHSHDVGLKSPNPWGLYDVLGNVAEWVDHYFTTSPLDYLTPGETLTDP
ncbi:MAG: SUMF1/EgtB/PvdO family nonheme iron enzyme, partial [Deltaproteobacteria bacterium]|nr:SUMF1/EgtB/PvdO family nonheme iron enzyme [Deltaproteobacteria bacterium]